MNYEPSPELANLLGLLVDDQISIEDNYRLVEIISADSGARAFYRDYINTHALMVWQVRPVGSLIDDETDAERADSTPPGEDFNPQPIVLDLSSPVNASAPFVGGWAFSYAVATVFVCMLLLGFWAYKLPSDRGSSIASSDNSRRSTTSGEKSITDRPAPVFVGRITGIAGAKWSDDPNYIAPIGIGVALGRTYKLKSGLMEITYDSGAKVILEGPCSYEVDSTAGGYLSLGKLVARVGAGGDGRGTGGAVSGQWSVTSMKDEGGRMKDESGQPNAASLATSHSPLATTPSPLHPLPSPLFAVRTPPAVVTPLGTEFGVEVAANGNSMSHVFQGRVRVQFVTGGTGLASDAILRCTGKDRSIELGEGEIVWIEHDAEGRTRIVDTIASASGEESLRFVRRISQFDLRAYFKTVLADYPVAYWRLNETGGNNTVVYDGAYTASSSRQGFQNGIFFTNTPQAGLGHEGPRPALYGGFEHNNRAPRFWSSKTDKGPTQYGYLVVDDSNALSITGALTLEAWVYVEAFGGSNRGVVAKYVGYPTDNRSFNLFISARGQAGFGISKDGTFASTRELFGSTVLPLNAWTHLAAVYDTSGPTPTMELFVNGVSDAKLAAGVPASVFDSTAPLWIGLTYEVNSSDSNFLGRIDEVAVYDRALSAARIAAHYGAARYDATFDEAAHYDAVSMPLFLLRTFFPVSFFLQGEIS